MSAHDPQQAFAVLDAFRDAGGRMLDTARIYSSSEQVVGAWLRAHPDEARAQGRAGRGVAARLTWDATIDRLLS